MKGTWTSPSPMATWLWWCSLAVLSLATGAHASAGDRSPMQRRCISSCVASNCSDDVAFHRSQPTIERLLMWSCGEECRYQCMWQTVEAFHAEGLDTPQFHGKWPFVRVLGIQEPASAVFSVCNLVPHITMLGELRRRVPASTPMFKVWSLYSVVSVNTWLWSTVFHTRDNDFTEMMDYFCAFSVVSFSLAAFLVRVLGPEWGSQCAAACLACAVGFLWHIYNMAFVHFDYGYNMIINISVGAVNSVCWLTWCFYYRHERPYVWKATVAVLCLNASILLELLDFAPVLWTFDSHSLWHMVTSPIHFVWYGFVIDDCQYLSNQVKKVKGA